MPASRQLDRPAQVSAGGLLLATGVTLRAIAQPLAVDAPFRPGALLLSAMLALVGVVLVIHAFARVIRGGVGVYVNAAGVPTLFDHESVSEVVGETERRSA